MPVSHDRHRRRAFTLIELLVVIAVLGVLASILIPVVSKVRATAQATHCMSNMQQLGRAFMLHAEDHRGLLPAPVCTAGGIVTPWYVAIHPYTGTPFRAPEAQGEPLKLAAVFSCPTWVRNDHQPKPEDIGYAMNAALGTSADRTRPVPLSSLQSPSRAILLLELIGSTAPCFPEAGSLAAFGATYSTTFGAEGCDRHEGTANYLFADGHVGRHTTEQVGSLLK
jgi:prepilin-type N-terminal cleavage/methylation domain-containing protein/prepilin-type processing-associated H-X9-DG protein